MRAIVIFAIILFTANTFFAHADYACIKDGTTLYTSPTLGACQGQGCTGACQEVSKGTPGSTNGGSGTTCPPNQFCNPLKSASFGALVQSLANWVTAIAIPIAAMFIIYSGFLFVTAGGNEAKLKAAKTTFYWTIIGAAIVVGAWALAAAIVNFAKGL